jgi:REP element-mobilizing transposase RayT
LVVARDGLHRRALLANTEVHTKFRIYCTRAVEYNVGVGRYVIMPDHFHLLANPLDMNIGRLAGRLKGRAASRILKLLRSENKNRSLAKLALRKPLASGQTHAVWLKDFSAIDIWSHKFIRQKLLYIHMNPVRAGLCDHPAKWPWSSYHAYLPHQPGTVAIEVDWRWLWSGKEFTASADKSAV